MAVLGPTLKRELFGETNPLGRFIRIGGYRFRVIGVMAPKGHMLGFDVDDAVYVPVASVLKMFNMEELIEVDVAFSYEGELDHVVKNIRKLLTLRHQNTEDFTITTQAAMLKVLDEVMNVVTMAVGAIAAISLFVGAMGILTVMWMAVGERTSEIGLLKATGARDSQIYHVFLMESVILAVIGGGVGILAGLSIVAFLPLFLPDLPVYPHTGYLGMAFLISVVVGICSGIFPAQRAASLDSLDALHID
jgi:putative ABC transport system permease protein